MNRKQHSVVLASLLALALAGCSSTRSGGADEMAGGATASGTGSSSSSGSSGGGGTGSSSGSTAQSSGTAPATGTTSGADTSAGSMPDSAHMPGAAAHGAMPAAPPNAVVMTIEAMPRPSAAGSAAMGTSGTSGSTSSSSAGDDKMYRITVRMDDGTTRVVTQDKAPTFRNGDRVNMMDGNITK
jgi:outer membrane lipoprotein SlyB